MQHVYDRVLEWRERHHAAAQLWQPAIFNREVSRRRGSSLDLTNCIHNEYAFIVTILHA